ncbi:uncharacterized protein C8Q71DRAFT_738742 [Rhodofomes roseus]|uniref:Uncharacterized protein n=1 Tax=Rhodofomes roseus TaxID=34475 RepID=A0ABQ8KSI0_9APHY|nr:uncharacterized protein C8Q71DRAFT_738742 [Rhodofomes roseus]KAH9841775.1 hypothetical protein C8Q71DRAFT_738742 [Rhodofomes roseus]
MSLTRETSHVPGNILGALCPTSGHKGAFHWLIYLCMDSNSGVMFHASRPNEQDPHSWEFHTAHWKAFESKSCLTLAVIGRVVDFDPRNPARAVEMMRGRLQPIPMAVPPEDKAREPKFTCRVRFRAALRLLVTHQAFQLSNQDSFVDRYDDYFPSLTITLPLYILMYPKRH